LGHEPTGSVPRYAAMMGCIFYALPKEVTAYQKIEEI
jgi:hypothetical protein